jgi:hypothetical protein
MLIDHNFEAGEEPVKLCVRDGVPIELRKQLPADLRYDTIGESVGFFRFEEHGARRLATLVAGYVERGGRALPHEEAVGYRHEHANRMGSRKGCAVNNTWSHHAARAVVRPLVGSWSRSP